jgi:hypothetical protein
MNGLINRRVIEFNKKISLMSLSSVEKSLRSAQRMELVTDAMYEIVKETKQETVSMRIITLVTLFFLPGTFISVSHIPFRIIL